MLIKHYFKLYYIIYITLTLYYINYNADNKVYSMKIVISSII